MVPVTFRAKSFVFMVCGAAEKRLRGPESRPETPHGITPKWCVSVAFGVQEQPQPADEPGAGAAQEDPALSPPGWVRRSASFRMLRAGASFTFAARATALAMSA